jgi:hypothetical protein
MRFVELTKPLVTQILSESLILEAEGKNTHLEHLEDNIFNKGYAGAKESINYLYSLHQMLEGNSKQKLNITTKWDGKPAIICGKDPQSGKFFVGTKGVFAQKPKLNFTPKDIVANHGPGELTDKLTLALKLLSKLNWNTVAQGDMLWAGKEDFKEAEIDGESYITFKPNTIVYAVPSNSDLAKQITAKQFGIVFHTEYKGGPSLADTRATFGFDSSGLGEATGVWHTDANIKDLSGTVTLTANESADILNAIKQADTYLKSIDQDTFNFLDKGAEVMGEKVFLPQLKAHVNANIKNVGEFEQNPTVFAQSFVQKYITYMEKEIAKVKTQKTIDSKTDLMVKGVKFIKEHVPQIVAVYDLYLKLIEAKLVFLNKLKALQQIPTFVEKEGGYEVTQEEGFVAVDRMGNAVKLVDRLDFSKNNFALGHGATK